MKSWDKLPEELKNKKVKKYYDLLKRKRVSLFFKRLFDIIVSLIMLIILSPILIILAILIKIDSKGPVFYRQLRVTKYNRDFRIFKFRTMRQDADKMGPLITVGEDKRITRVGRLIRKGRIDELPQLINVLIGDMTFVGTRPEVRRYVDKYTDEMKATLLLKAGITSPASIMYHNEDEIMEKYTSKGESVDDVYLKRVLPDKMKYNLMYLKEFNFFRDIKIMIDTFLVVAHIKKIK